ERLDRGPGVVDRIVGGKDRLSAREPLVRRERPGAEARALPVAARRRHVLGPDPVAPLEAHDAEAWSVLGEPLAERGARHPRSDDDDVDRVVPRHALLVEQPAEDRLDLGGELGTLERERDRRLDEAGLVADVVELARGLEAEELGALRER